MTATVLAMRLYEQGNSSGNSEDRVNCRTAPWPSPQKGMILIALLWILAALSLLALNLSSTVRGELNVASASAQGEKAYFFARGGLEAALYQLVYPSADPEKQKARFPYRDGMNHFWISSDDWFCHVAVQDEAGKIDLNFANEAVLKRLMQNTGVEEPRAEAIVESILRRREGGGSQGSRDSGAPHAPAARRHLFTSIEELLLVDGISREVMYGAVRKGRDGEARLYRGLADFITVYSEKVQINLNYAEPEVIAALPGIDSQAAAIIVSSRAEESLSASRMSQQIAGLIPGEAAGLTTTDPSRVYCLVATAFLKNSKLRTSVRAVVKLDGTLKWGHSKLIWYDEYWPSERIQTWTNTLPALENLNRVGT
jgi:type II secretory pathway component PulK